MDNSQENIDDVSTEYVAQDMIFKQRAGKDHILDKKISQIKIVDIDQRQTASKYMRHPPGIDALFKVPITVLLVYGYIRNVHKSLNKIIPTDINILCYNFYHYKLSNTFILIQHNESKINTIHLDVQQDTNFIKHTNIKTKTLKLKSPSSVISHSSTDNMKGAAICKATNIELPIYIKDQLCTKPQPNNFDIVFRCGGEKSTWRNTETVNYCIGFILTDDEEFESKTVYEWQLPDIPVSISNAYSLYDHEYGLFCIGGTQISRLRNSSFLLETVQNLSFDENIFEWKWKVFCKMERGLMGSCAVMIKSGHNKTKLIVCGGETTLNVKSGNNTVNLYDLEKKKWDKMVSMRFKRYNAGIFYDRKGKRIYIGGGTGSGGTKIEYYDMMKSQWMTIATTWNIFSNNPNIWSENENLVYIASSGSLQCVERIDLRMSMFRNVTICSTKDYNMFNNVGAGFINSTIIRMH